MEKYKSTLCVFLVCSTLAACAAEPTKIEGVETWAINSLTQMNGHEVESLGNPQIIETTMGKATRFDGIGDRLLVNANPLADATEFTIEIILKPHDAFPKNAEPRIFHIESIENPNRRITLELRLNDQHQWYLDAYIKSESGQLALLDPTKTHPTDKWFHAAMTYQNRELTTYVNGQKELVGQVQYSPIALTAKTAIGSRMNKVYWFNGDILQVRVTKKSLRPDAFLLLNN